MDNLAELLEEQVKDLYSAENQLLKALPRMAKKASSEDLKAAFLQHAEETQGHVDRIAQVAELLGTKPTGKVCAAMKGLIEEGKEVMEEDGHDAIIDAALIAASQRIEHYEIAAYGTVKAIATVLGNQELVDLFEETLAEEVATDEKLTGVAEELYATAPKGEEEEEGEEGEEEEEDEAPASKGKGGTGRGAAGKTAAAAKGGRSSGGGSTGGSSGKSKGGSSRR